MNPGDKLETLDSALARAGGLIRSGRPDQAVTALDPVRRKFPDHPDVLKLSGMALSMMGRLDEAEAMLRARLVAAPESAAARSDLANVLINLGRPEEALDLLEGLDPERLDETSRFNLGRAFKGVGRTEEAAASFEVVLKVSPRHVGALLSLGDCYKALGRADEASGLFREAIRQNPGNGVAWWSLSNLKAGGFDSTELAELGQLASQSRPPAQQHYFEFAYATALAQAGQHEQAFEHYARGNRMKRSLSPWRRHRFEKWLAAVDRVFAKQPFPDRPARLQSPRPIFIVSLPRSGSTLTEQIFAAHPSVTAASELPWIPRILGEESRRLGRDVADWAGEASDDDWRRLGSEYLDRSAYWQSGSGIFTDKLPGNFPYTPAILKMFPAALVVNVQRDARDVCWSCYRQLFISGADYSYDLADLASFWRLHRDFMSGWAERSPNRVLHMSYEELVRNPEQESRRLVEFAGLPWDERCLEYYRADRPVNTASASQVREKINTRGMGHWKRYEKQLQPLLDALAAERVIN